jgi:4-hydroxy-2-oxoheptanedioate aldolase
MAARMTPNHVKQKLRAGTPSVGSWLNIGSPTSAETLAALGFDWLCVDMEHGQIDLETLAAMLAAVGRYPVAPLARVPEITEGAIKRVLDAGAWGFVAPDVRSREEVELMVAAAKYPPAGVRSFGGGRHALSFRTDPLTYFRRANDEVLVVAQIEHVDAIRRIDDILAVPGLDACYTGPSDLCASAGLTPALEPEDPEFEAMMQTLLAAARRRGVIPGIHCGTPEYANRRLAEGWTLVGIVNDLRFLTAAARSSREAIKA